MSEPNYCGKPIPQLKVIGLGIVDGDWVEYHENDKYTKRGKFIKVNDNSVMIEFGSPEFSITQATIHYQVNDLKTIEQLISEQK